MCRTREVVQKLQEFFAQNPMLELWLLEFGLTHQRGRLRILRGGITDWFEMIFDGCTYICGSPVGGPFLLQIAFIPGDTVYNDEVMIHSVDKQFIIRCNRVVMDRVYGEYCKHFFSQVEESNEPGDARSELDGALAEGMGCSSGGKMEVGLHQMG